jgi:hypothetical protein
MSRTIITVAENELYGKYHIHEGISILCNEVRKVHDVYSYQPSSGKLFEIIQLLKVSRISYGTHSSI